LIARLARLLDASIDIISLYRRFSATLKTSAKSTYRHRGRFAGWLSHHRRCAYAWAFKTPFLRGRLGSEHAQTNKRRTRTDASLASPQTALHRAHAASSLHQPVAPAQHWTGGLRVDRYVARVRGSCTVPSPTTRFARGSNRQTLERTRAARW